MEVGQNIKVWRGQEATYVYLVAGAANVTAADWYCARSANSLAEDHLLDLAVGDGIALQNANGDIDLLVTVTLTPERTEGLPIGLLYTELWLTRFAAPIPVSSGTLSVHDSLRN